VRRLLAVGGYRQMVPGPCRGLGSAVAGLLQLAAAPPLPRSSCGWIRLGAQRFCLLVCAGQAVLRTVSMAVRAMGRLNARVHGQIADSVGAANPGRRRLRRSAAMWCA
jgi:hypothetical protein